MTPAQAATLRWFRASEFRHVELVDFAAAKFLDNVRDRYGAPIVLTSDARTEAENAAASGSSPTSYHLSGRAFDFRLPASAEALWKLVAAVVAEQHVYGGPVELELVRGPTDRHVHLALMPAGRVSRLVLALD